MKFKFEFTFIVCGLFLGAILAGFLLIPGSVTKTTNGSPRVGSSSVITSDKTIVVNSTGQLAASIDSATSSSGRPRVFLGVAVDGEDSLDIDKLQEKVLLDMDFINVMNDGGTGQVDSTITKERMLLLLKIAATRPGLINLMNEVGYISENYANTDDLESKRKMVARLKECRAELRNALFKQVPVPNTSSNVGLSGEAAAGKTLVAPGEIEKPKTFQ